MWHLYSPTARRLPRPTRGFSLWKTRPSRRPSASPSPSQSSTGNTLPCIVVMFWIICDLLSCLPRTISGLPVLSLCLPASSACHCCSASASMSVIMDNVFFPNTSYHLSYAKHRKFVIRCLRRRVHELLSQRGHTGWRTWVVTGFWLVFVAVRSRSASWRRERARRRSCRGCWRCSRCPAPCPRSWCSPQRAASHGSWTWRPRRTWPCTSGSPPRASLVAPESSRHDAHAIASYAQSLS